MTGFKPGDRVRAVKESWGDEYAPVGAVGTVVWAPGGTSVHFDGYPSPPFAEAGTSLTGDGWSMNAWQLEHVGSAAVRRVRRLAARRRTRHLQAVFAAYEARWKSRGRLLADLQRSQRVARQIINVKGD